MIFREDVCTIVAHRLLRIAATLCCLALMVSAGILII